MREKKGKEKADERKGKVILKQKRRKQKKKHNNS